MTPVIYLTLYIRFMLVHTTHSYTTSSTHVQLQLIPYPNYKCLITPLDATKNELHHPYVEVRGFPTFYFFTADNMPHPVEYDGERSGAQHTRSTLTRILYRPVQYTQSIYPLNTPSQHTLSTHHPLNTPSHDTFNTPSTHLTMQWWPSSNF